jgi:hypothetical protein
MEVIYPSETSVDFHRPTLRYIPEDRTLLDDNCENLKCNIVTTALLYLQYCFTDNQEPGNQCFGYATESQSSKIMEFKSM